jgi:hypothetical protein
VRRSGLTCSGCTWTRSAAIPCSQNDEIRLAQAYQAGLHARRTLASVDPDDPARPQLQAAVAEGERSYGSRRDAEAPHRRLTTEEPFFAVLGCARPDAAWVRFDSNDHYAGHSPYALYTSGDGGAYWRGVLSTLGAVLPVHLPAGPGSHPGPFSVIDPERAFLLSQTPFAEATGAVQISQGSRPRRLPDIPETTLSTMSPLSVSFASATRGWVVGAGTAGRAVILATADGGRHWQDQLAA